jgi:hypothetical protein
LTDDYNVAVRDCVLAIGTIWFNTNPAYSVPFMRGVSKLYYCPPQLYSIRGTATPSWHYYDDWEKLEQKEERKEEESGP